MSRFDVIFALLIGLGLVYVIILTVTAKLAWKADRDVHELVEHEPCCSPAPAADIEARGKETPIA